MQQIIREIAIESTWNAVRELKLNTNYNQIKLEKRNKISFELRNHMRNIYVMNRNISALFDTWVVYLDPLLCSPDHLICLSSTLFETDSVQYSPSTHTGLLE